MCAHVSTGQSRAEQSRCVSALAVQPFSNRPCKWSFSFWSLLDYILLSPHAGTLVDRPQSEWHVSIFAHRHTDDDNRLPGRREERKKNVCSQQVIGLDRLGIVLLCPFFLSFFLSVLCAALCCTLPLFNQVQGRLGRDHKKGVLVC